MLASRNGDPDRIPADDYTDFRSKGSMSRMTNFPVRNFQSIMMPATVVGRLIHLALSAAAIVALSFALGNVLLEDPLKGGDSALHIAYTQWLSQYFPNVPHWFPEVGGGVSLLHGYPILAHYSVIILHQLSELTLLQSSAVIGWITFPITAIGIYLFCWSALKNQTVGLIAAVFFLLAPLSWTWIHDWGFFPYSVGLVYLPMALLLYDRYLSLVLKNPRSPMRRLWMIGLVASIVLATLTHPSAAAGAVLLIVLYSLFYSITTKSQSRSRVLLSGAKAGLICGVMVAMILAFYLVPFSSYGRIANREGLNLLPVHLVPHLPKAEFFGLKPIDISIIHTRMSNPLAVSALLLGGLALSWRTSRKALALTFAALFAAIYALFPQLPFSLSNLSSSLAMVFSIRAALGAVMILFPVGAAYGAVALGFLLISPVIWLRNNATRTIGLGGLQGFVASGLGIVLAIAALFWIGQIQSSTPYIVDYGPSSAGIDLRDVWNLRSDDSCELPTADTKTLALCQEPRAREELNVQEFLMECDRAIAAGYVPPSLCSDPSPSSASIEEFKDQCDNAESFTESMRPCEALVEGILAQLSPANWPVGPVAQIKDSNWLTESVAELGLILPDDEPVRIDISSRYAGLAQFFTVFSGTSQIQTYTNQLSLIHAIWGYQSGIFYSEELGSPQSINELADWLGIQYVFLNPDHDPVDKFAAAGWRTVSSDVGAYAMENPGAPGLATISTRPTVLVIGGQSNGSYAQLYKLAIEGVAPYEEFTLVEGSDRIDKYSLDELLLFDTLFLHGYDYKNGDKAWKLLDQYVRSGGSIFLDTGWQFEIPEWEFEQTPSVIPLSELAWRNAGQENSYRIEGDEIASGIDSTKFDPLIWEDSPWGFASADSGKLREWGRPILSHEGYPLLAGGEYGEGRVVWSGMNLLSHVIAYDNPEEQLLLNRLLNWLGGDREDSQELEAVVERSHPDRVDFSASSLQGDRPWLYWREAWYPNWHAKLTEGETITEVPIFRAGPGFMLMPLGLGGGQTSIALEWELSGLERLSWYVSGLGIVVALAFIVDGLFLRGNGLTWMKIAVLMRIPRPFLGDGHNNDWAERKRAEIVSGAAGLGPSANGEESAESQDEKVPAGSEIAGQRIEQHHGSDDARADDPDVNYDDEAALLESWLDSTQHSDDRWAAKLLGNRDQDEAS